MAELDEQPLVGGNVAAGLVRVGDTIRRPSGPWSASVDALLLHLAAVGYRGAPRALGYDDRGRQVLSYVPGFVDPDPADLTTVRLVAIGRMIREFHDAVKGFVPPPDASWDVAVSPDAEELICHNDIAPWNLVRGEALVLIDWDGAGPGSRLWDLAYALHSFVPLSAALDLDQIQLAQRLRALARGYDVDGADRKRLLDLLARRLWSMHELLAAGHRHGIEPWNRLWLEGHGDAWAADARYVESHSQLLAAALLD